MKLRSIPYLQLRKIMAIKGRLEGKIYTTSTTIRYKMDKLPAWGGWKVVQTACDPGCRKRYTVIIGPVRGHVWARLLILYRPNVPGGTSRDGRAAVSFSYHLPASFAFL